MNLVVVCAVTFGIGAVGCWCALRPAPASLGSLEHARSGDREPVREWGRTHPGRPGIGAVGQQLGSAGVRVAGLVERRLLQADVRAGRFRSALDVTGQSLEGLSSRALVGVVVGLIVPPVLWSVAAAGGVEVPVLVPIVLTLAAVPLGAILPVASVLAEARERRRHFRVVVGTFVDLVVLGLAGGVGIEGALQSAASVSSDWASVRIARSLLLARDRGESPWEALGRLGERCGVNELTELAATLGLAGTEGARIRQALSARAASFRRHEQAEAESAANSMTERLFFPGALLLIGFLLFVGYPAFSRILTGF